MNVKRRGRERNKQQQKTLTQLQLLFHHSLSSLNLFSSLDGEKCESDKVAYFITIDFTTLKLNAGFQQPLGKQYHTKCVQIDALFTHAERALCPQQIENWAVQRQIRVIHK